MRKNMKSLIGLSLLSMLLLIGNSSAICEGNVGIKAGDSLKYTLSGSGYVEPMSWVLTVDNVTDAESGCDVGLTLTIESIIADQDTIYISNTPIIVDAEMFGIGVSYFVINKNADPLSDIHDNGYYIMTLVYDANGVLKKYEVTENGLSHFKLVRGGGGIPGYSPLLILGFSLLVVGLITLKLKKKLH